MTAIAAALERKVWLPVQGRRLYCNLYVLLVGPPGIGKTTAIEAAREPLLSVKDLRLAPTKITKEKFTDVFSKTLKLDQGLDEGTHSSLSAFINEFGVFLRARDFEFMTDLVDLYDCPRLWDYSTLSRGSSTIEHAWFTFIAGTTPKSLANNIGAEALGMGFTARLLMIYSEEQQTNPLFATRPQADLAALEADINLINDLRGPFQIEPAAAHEAESWVRSGMPPIPSDSRFAEYNPRRARHWLKLAMLYAVSRQQDLLLTVEDLALARETLLEAEMVMPHALELIGQNPLAEAITQTHRWALIEYLTTRTPLSEARVRKRLLQMIPVQYLQSALDNLVMTGLFSVLAGESPNRLLVPVKQERRS